MGLPPTALLLPHACFADSYAPYATAAPMTGRTGQLGQSCQGSNLLYRTVGIGIPTVPQYKKQAARRRSKGDLDKR